MASCRKDLAAAKLLGRQPTHASLLGKMLGNIRWTVQPKPTALATFRRHSNDLCCIFPQPQRGQPTLQEFGPRTALKPKQRSPPLPQAGAQAFETSTNPGCGRRLGQERIKSGPKPDRPVQHRV